MSRLLPIFPLDVVLLPGVPLPLHIFEPRYKEMISECISQKLPFGVVRAKEEGIAEIGCTAEILHVAKTYDDGRMDIATQGKRRFEIMATNQERSFLRAEVLYLDDEPQTTAPDDIAKLLQLRAEIVRLAGSEPAGEAEIEKDQLSFQLAGSLPLDLDFKQTLLGMKSEAERVQALVSYLDAVLPRLRQSIQAHRKAGGNGHVR